MKIPIQNIYYLLCYAWNKLNEADLIKVTPLDRHTVLDLLANVLATGVGHLLKQGLDRGYVPHKEETSTIRGKVMFTQTLKRTYFQQPKVYCEFDDLSHNIRHNQIIKTMLDKLHRCTELDVEIRLKVRDRLRRLPGIDVIPLTRRDFGRVQLHSNNSFYEFLLRVCELLFDNLLPSEEEGEIRFQDFERDERKMAYLFEEFVRNFYKLEQEAYHVRRENINWLLATNIDKKESIFSKIMQTDISLSSPLNKIIIDTKFYREALQKYYDREKVISANLYQIHAYMTNLMAYEQKPIDYEGILLYPTVDQSICESEMTHGYRFTVATINLNQTWNDIHRDLLRLIKIGKTAITI